MKQPTAFDRARAGIKLAVAIEEAMQAVAQTEKAATVDANGDVHMDKSLVFLMAFGSGNVAQKMEEVFALFWEATKDKATHHHRAKWSRERQQGLKDLPELKVNIDTKALEASCSS